MKANDNRGVDAETAAGTFDLEQFLPYRLSVATSQVSKLFARHFAERFGLTIAEWRILAVLGKVGTCSPTAVGEAAAMDKVKVSRAAAAMVDKGLLRQSADPNDGRGRLLRVTRKGAALHGRAVPVALELEAAIAAGMTRGEWASLDKTLVRLAAHVGTIEGPVAAAPS